MKISNTFLTIRLPMMKITTTSLFKGHLQLTSV